MLSLKHISTLLTCCLLSFVLASATTIQPNQQSKVSTTARPTTSSTRQQDHTTTRASDVSKNETLVEGSGKREHSAFGHHDRLLTKTSSAKQRRKFKLPSWFNFNLYKQFYGKHYPGRLENEIHKRIYLKTGLQVFEQRALYRAGRIDSLASINELSDLTADELEAFKDRNQVKPVNLNNVTKLSDCCNYDQVYEQIVQLLNRTTGPVSADLPLSKAVIDELEQKPLIEYEQSSEREQQQEPLNSTSKNHTQPMISDAKSGKKNLQTTNPREASIANRDQDETTIHISSKDPSNDDPSGSSGTQIEIPQELEEAIRRQVAEQLAANSPIANRLNAKLSAYFNEPVAVRPPTSKPLPRIEPIKSLTNKTTVVKSV